MARLRHHMSLVAPAIISLLLLLLAAAVAPAANAADDTPANNKVGMRIRYADKEEAQWLDRYAETHQPLGAGPLRLVRATPEEEHWLNRLSDASTTDGEDGAGGSSGGGYIDFDDDNPYVHALRDWVSRLTKQSMEKAAQAENPFQDL